MKPPSSSDDQETVCSECQRNSGFQHSECHLQRDRQTDGEACPPEGFFSSFCAELQLAILLSAGKYEMLFLIHLVKKIFFEARQ